MVVSRKLPPSERDFQLYRTLVIEGASTYDAAEVFKISQTRVRQVQRKVVDWAAEILPPETGTKTENLLKIMQIAASERLEHAYAEAIAEWQHTSEPKFLNMVLRVIQSEVRLKLPARAGMLESLVEKLRADEADDDLAAPGDEANDTLMDDDAGDTDQPAGIEGSDPVRAGGSPPDDAAAAARAAAEAAFEAKALARARALAAEHGVELAPSVEDCSAKSPSRAGLAEPPQPGPRVTCPPASKLGQLLADDPFWKAEKSERLSSLLKPPPPNDRS